MYARRHGLLAVVPARRSRLAEHQWMMGRFTDALIARVAGCTAAYVTAYRRKQGIPPANYAVIAETRAAVERVKLHA